MDTRNKILTKLIPISIAVILFIITTLLCGQIIGFDQGLQALNSSGTNGNGKLLLDHSGGPSAHLVFGILYALNSLWFCLYITAKFLEQTILSKAVPLALLSLSIYIFWQVISYKNNYLRENEILIYYTWIESSIIFDRLCILVSMGLALFQATILMFCYFDSKKHTK